MSDYVYAVLDDSGMVTNIVVADNPDATVPLGLLLPDASAVILTTEETGPALIGGDMLDGKFRGPRPYLSWEWDGDAWTWVAPVPYPNDGGAYYWDEDAGDWVEVTA